MKCQQKSCTGFIVHLVSSRVETKGILRKAKDSGKIEPTRGTAKLFRWNDFNQNSLRVRAVAPGQPNASEPARDDEERRAISISPFIEAKLTLAHERRAVGKTNLATVSVTRQRKRNAMRFGFVKEIRVMCQKEMGWAMFGYQPIPIGHSQDTVIDSSENKAAVPMR